MTIFDDVIGERISRLRRPAVDGMYPAFYARLIAELEAVSIGPDDFGDRVVEAAEIRDASLYRLSCQHLAALAKERHIAEVHLDLATYVSEERKCWEQHVHSEEAKKHAQERAAANVALQTALSEDLRHREKINQEVIDSLSGVLSLYFGHGYSPTDLARNATIAIAKGRVPHLRIDYALNSDPEAKISYIIAELPAYEN